MQGILFNHQYSMFQGTVLGIKTQTRRAGAALKEINLNSDSWTPVSNKIHNGTFTFHYKGEDLSKVVYPRYQTAEKLFLKEPILTTKTGLILYKYPKPEETRPTEFMRELMGNVMDKQGINWKNKLFMGQQYARYFVKITAVRIERLREISYIDCLNEGIQVNLEFNDQGAIDEKFFYSKDNVKMFFPTAQKAYFSLYNAVGKKNDNTNPWVFIYDYELCEA